MKRFSVFLVGMFSLLFLQAQPTLKTKIIQPWPLGVSCDKTSNIIFPSNIISVDRGNGSVLAQKAKGVENILQIKADTAYFATTNLSIVTADAKFYSFLLLYDDQPSVLNLQILVDSVTPALKLTDLPIGKASFDKVQQEIVSRAPFLNKRVKNQKMNLVLHDIFLKDSLLLFGIKLSNKSLLDYRIEGITFFVKDRKKFKRTSIQKIQLTPVYNTPLKIVGGMESVDLVFAFNPFTYLDSQNLVIQVTEEDGGRILELPVKSKTLLKVRTL